MALEAIIHVKCSKELDTRLRNMAAIQGVSIASIVKTALSTHLNEFEAKQSRMARIANAEPPEM